MGSDIAAFLSETNFFKGIAGGSLSALAEIAVPKTIGKRELLFLEGDVGRSLYILVEGTIQIYKAAADGREIVIKTVLPGEVFGEVVLFEEKRYPVNARALSKCRLLMLPRVQIDCLLAEDAFRRDFIGMLMRKQRYLAGRILHLSAHDVEDRFFEFLREQYGEKQTYSITLSKKDLAAAIGTIPETFSRLILRLKKDGTIRWDGKTIVLREGFWESREELD